MKAHPSESQTRQEIIDQQLAIAGWGVSSRSMVEAFFVLVNWKRILPTAWLSGL